MIGVARKAGNIEPQPHPKPRLRMGNLDEAGGGAAHRNPDDDVDIIGEASIFRGSH
jgi:hypothetical protein